MEPSRTLNTLRITDNKTKRPPVLNRRPFGNLKLHRYGASSLRTHFWRLRMA